MCSNGANGDGSFASRYTQANGMQERRVRGSRGPNETVAEDLIGRRDGWRRHALLCGVRLARTGRRVVRFGLFSLEFDEGLSANVKAMWEGLNVIYRRHRGW
jgi:hypothetical protein